MVDRRSFLKVGAFGAVVAAPGLATGATPSDPTKLLVTVGTPEWEATQEELVEIQELFTAWLKSPDNCALVVRSGIQVQAGHLAEIKVLQIDKVPR